VTATSTNSRTFTYDNNGNQITRTGFNVTWYPFNLPKQISATGNNTSTFMYNPNGGCWSQSAVHSGVGETTTYIGGLMEVVQRLGVTSYRHYISGGTGTVAEHIRDSSGLVATRYLTKDHLGSVDSVTSSTGSVHVRLSYDAFGSRRNEAGWSGAVPAADMANMAADTRRGFTEHDMLDNVGLIHMNGRVFDRVTGRFISADPFIDGADHTQGWNRYSYVKNAPLSFTDPTGFRCYTTCLRQNGVPLGVAGLSGFSGFNGSGGGWGGSAGSGEGPHASMEGVTREAPRIRTITPTMQANLERDLGLSRVSVSLSEYVVGDPSSSDSESIQEVVVSGRRGSTAGGTQIFDTITAPWGGWDGFKYSVRCVWECDWPGNGSLDANLAGLPPIIGAPVGVGRSAFEIARAGGKHAGFLKNYLGRSPSEIQKAVTSIEKQIADHQSWISNPELKIPNFRSLDPRQQAALVNSKWPSDIARQQEQLDILRGLLGGQ
jgi:RHS repeat-associated protein